jgi:hypothetical protein
MTILIRQNTLLSDMRNESPSAFAKAREEVQFWPAAALAYVFTTNGSQIVLAACVFSVLTGAMGYKFHETLREAFERADSKTRTGKRVARDGLKQELSERVIQFSEAGSNAWEYLSPSHPLVSRIAYAGVSLNVVIGIVTYLWILGRIISPANPGFTLLTVFFLPVLMLTTTVISFVWTCKLSELYLKELRTEAV